MNLSIPLLFIIINTAANVGLTIQDIKKIKEKDIDKPHNIAFMVLLGAVILVSLIVGGLTLMYASKFVIINNTITNEVTRSLIRYLICLTVLFAMYGTSVGVLLGINKKNKDVQNDYDVDLYAFISWIVVTIIFITLAAIVVNQLQTLSKSTT